MISTEIVDSELYIRDTPDLELINSPTMGDVESTCPVFELPPWVGPEPVPDLSDDRYQTYLDVELALGQHINALRRYITEQRALLEQHYNHYLDRCR